MASPAPVTPWAKCTITVLESPRTRLFLKAGEQGYDRAQYNLGKTYRDGDGTDKNLVEAVKWYRKAAEQGYAKAQSSLGVRYARSEGVAKDEVRALMWTILAANQGLKRAVDDRAYLAKSLSPEDVARAEKLAADWKPITK